MLYYSRDLASAISKSLFFPISIAIRKYFLRVLAAKNGLYVYEFVAHFLPGYETLCISIFSTIHNLRVDITAHHYIMMYQGMTHVPHARRRVEKIMNPNSLLCTIHLSITKTNERYKGCFGEESCVSESCITLLSWLHVFNTSSTFCCQTK